MLTFDLLREPWPCWCETMALALESDLRTMIGEVARGHGYEHIQRYTYVLLNQQAYYVRSPTTCYNTSECKALRGEPEEAPFFSICAHTYVTAAGEPVSHRQFHWPVCFCRKHAS